ncbi:MAG: hypothetical protein U0168_08540 [Nannocystaceae bacterium]
MLAGAEVPDAGEVVARTGLRVGYLEQQPTSRRARAPAMPCSRASMRGKTPSRGTRPPPPRSRRATATPTRWPTPRPRPRRGSRSSAAGICATSPPTCWASWASPTRPPRSRA